jgi:hypothetical protein
MRGLLAMWLTVLCVTPAVGQPTKFYDKQGNYRGAITREGSRDVVRDQNGNPKGYYEQQGHETIQKDLNGNRLGSSRP